MIKSSKYSKSVNEDLEFRVLNVLSNSPEALSTQQIQTMDIVLSHHTPQKLSRVLGKLIDMGFARKGKSKATGRMMYKSVAVMIKQGYRIDGDIFGQPTYQPDENRVLNMTKGNVNWELEAEVNA